MITIKTPYDTGTRHDETLLASYPVASYFTIGNTGQSVALYKKAIPDIIVALTKIHNGEAL